MNKAAGLIYGPNAHHLDHLAVICHLMKIPLLISDEEISNLARVFYPAIEVIQWDYLTLPKNLVENYTFVFSSLPRAIFDEIFFFSQQLFKRKVHTIWCPHGNSDKGHLLPMMEALKDEKFALVYGQKMIDFLKNKKVFKQLKLCIETGNIRYKFYRDHKAFYDKLTSLQLKGRLKPGAQTLLYAPTWQDQEKSSSFFSACPHLIEKLPEDYNLIIKLHPNIFLQNESKARELIWNYEHRDRVIFLSDFPPIYPLLNIADIYIGDMSSIGYDFLLFDRPMFFLNQNHRDAQKDEGLYLFRAGVEIIRESYENIYAIIDRHLSFQHPELSEKRKEIYAYTFHEEKDWESLRQEINRGLAFFQDDLESFL